MKYCHKKVTSVMRGDHHSIADSQSIIFWAFSWCLFMCPLIEFFLTLTPQMLHATEAVASHQEARCTLLMWSFREFPEPATLATRKPHRGHGSPRITEEGLRKICGGESEQFSELRLL